MIIQILLWAILPSILITIYVAKKDLFPEPNKAIASALALGFLIFIPHTFFFMFLGDFYYEIYYDNYRDTHFINLIESFFQAAFVEEFNKMVKVWKPEGYLSLGGIFGGQGIEGESHYIYTTYNTYEEMLSFGPKTAKEQKAFEEFIKNTDAISDFKGTYSVINVQTWN